VCTDIGLVCVQTSGWFVYRHRDGVFTDIGLVCVQTSAWCV
jgi:hypothetical protein